MTKKDLKIFGLIWASIFFLIAIFPITSGNEMKIFSFYISILFILISLINPIFFRQIYFYQSWEKFGNFIGKINSKIVIIVLFYGFFSPIGIVLKILRKDLLKKKINKATHTYFIERNEQPQSMNNQF